MRIAVYPGSFDPFTNGHMDILERAASLFDEVIVGVLINQNKKCWFSLEERVAMIKELCAPLQNVNVMSFDGLLVNFCEEVGAKAIIRGLRAVTDYEYEVQMYAANHHMKPNIETIFLMSQPQYSFLSSSVVKEIACYKGNIEALVAPSVASWIAKKTNSLNK